MSSLRLFPDVISTSVNDDLTATALVFGYGDEVAVIVGLTVCIIDDYIVDAVRRLVEQKYIATQDQLCRGGYEIESFKTIYEQPLVDNADWYLVAHSVKNLNKLKEKE